MDTRVLFIIAALLAALGFWEVYRDRRAKKERECREWTVATTEHLRRVKDAPSLALITGVVAMTLPTRAYIRAISRQTHLLIDLQAALEEAKQRVLGSQGEDAINGLSFHVYVLQRNGGPGAVLQLVTPDPDPAAAWTAFRTAVTQWVGGTCRTAKSMVDEAEGELNIGDLLKCDALADPCLGEQLDAVGIVAADADFVDASCVMQFDTPVTHAL